MLGDHQLLQGVVCGDTALKSQSLVSTQLHGISSKADAGTEQTWVPHPSELLAIPMHNWGQVSPGASIHRKPLLCVLPVVPLVSALQHSTQSLCCFAGTPWVSVPSSVPPRGAAQRGLGAPRQTVGTECLLCHHLQLLPARPQSPGCAGPVLEHPSSPSSPGQCCWPQPWLRGATRGAGHCRRH